MAGETLFSNLAKVADPIEAFGGLAADCEEGNVSDYLMRRPSIISGWKTWESDARIAVLKEFAGQRESAT